MPKRDALKPVAGFLETMRPKQWTKNLIVFAPLIFAGRFTSVEALAASCLCFAVFCAVSGSVYVINDIRDLEQDQHHHVKRSRPIAAGRLSPRTAAAATAVILAAATGASFALSLRFGAVVTGYLALQIAYTLWLKHAVILDVMSIAAGFILRALGGAVAVGVAASPWLYACAALLALFLGFGKRRHELLLLEDGATDHRAVLADYSTELLDILLGAVTAATIVAYLMYTFFSPTAAGSYDLMLTVPFVVYGLFRYVYLMYKHNLGGSPEEILLNDKPLIATILLWVALSGLIIYLS